MAGLCQAIRENVTCSCRVQESKVYSVNVIFVREDVERVCHFCFFNGVYKLL